MLLLQWVVFEKQRHCEPAVQWKCLMPELILIYISMDVRLLHACVSSCAHHVFVFVFVWYQISKLAKPMSPVWNLLTWHLAEPSYQVSSSSKALQILAHNQSPIHADFHGSDYFWARENQQPNNLRQETLLNKLEELQDLWSLVNIATQQTFENKIIEK